MSFCCRTGLIGSRDNIQIRDTHIQIATSYFCYTMSVTHPITRTQDISTCRPFGVGVFCSSTQGNLLFLLHSSILSKHDECSPEVLLCLHEILFQVHVDISDDFTVKGTRKFSDVHQLGNPSVPLCHVTCAK